MSNWEYKREDFAPKYLPGEYRVEIVEVEEGLSKSSGTPMITITIKPNGMDLRLKQYIVKGQWFNKNMTMVFDSFNIDEGDFDLVGWIGAVGAAKLVKDPNNPKFLKIAWFISKDAAASLPPWKGPKPERQRVIDGNTFVQMDDNEDLPF